MGKMLPNEREVLGIGSIPVAILRFLSVYEQSEL